MHEFDRCVGIEILKGLFELSLAIKLRYEITRLCILDQHKDIWSSLPDVDLVHGDIFVNGWNDASVIFANSTCFEQDMIDLIADSEARVGTWAITLTKCFMSDKWKVLQSFRKNMSWGDATIYIHRRVA